MLIRVVFPYLLLALVICGYIYFRYKKLGTILFKVNRVLFSRYNLDSLLLIIMISVGSYFLSGLDLHNVPAAQDAMVLGPYTYSFFYLVLILTVIVREVEKPAIRERGISTPRGFYLWSEIASFQWIKNTLKIMIARGNKKRSEIWEVELSDKKKLDQLLKEFVPKSSRSSKKKSH
ncbi:MAG: DUF5673 domain-containing protein [Bacillota bacterium]